jgi:hypothetical protein
VISLWPYAATEGVGSARELARLCEQSDAYKWLCGGVSLNHHTLGDFRVGHKAALDALFTQVLAMMVDQGIVTVERISNDGTRLRACAGAVSFRGAERLATLLAEAPFDCPQGEAHVAALLDDPERSAELTARERAAQRRAARVERVQAAIESRQGWRTVELTPAERRVTADRPRPTAGAASRRSDAGPRAWRSASGRPAPAAPGSDWPSA